MNDINDKVQFLQKYVNRRGRYVMSGAILWWVGKYLTDPTYTIEELAARIENILFFNYWR